MNLELTFGNDAAHLPSVQAFLQATLAQLPLPAASRTHLETFIMAATRDALQHAYPPGEEGLVRLTIRAEHGRLEIQLRDFGLPKDVKLLERQLHGPRPSASEALSVADEVHWVSFGPEGKALQLIIWLHQARIQVSSASQSDEPARAVTPRAPEQPYTIRRMHADESEQVAQLMYQTYGSSYFNEDVYYPERIAAQNARGIVLSFVAVTEDGEVAGHYALERNQPGPVAEGGQAVVSSAHRGRGLLDRMKQHALEEARKLKLVGWYADAVTVHVLSQQANVAQGATLTAVDLAIAPRTEHFDQQVTQPQRVTCLSFFQWLGSPKHRRVHVPQRHQPMVRQIYEGLGCPIDFADAHPPSGEDRFTVKVSSGAARATISVDDIGAQTVQRMGRARRELVERHALEVIYAELPLTDPATAPIATELEADGFGFLGLAPHASLRGDVLRLAYLVEPVDRAAIHVLEPVAGELLDYVLQEQQRVRASLL